MMMNKIEKRSVIVAGHKTSVSLEDAFWSEIKRLAKREKLTIAQFVGAVDRDRPGRNLSSSLRIAVLEAVQAEAALLAGAVATARATNGAAAHV